MEKDSIDNTRLSSETVGGSVDITFYPPKEKSKGVRKKIEAWPKLFMSFENAKPPSSQDKNDLPGFSPATFTNDVRKNENVESLFALVWDFDKGTTTIEEALAFYQGHLACAYTSWSHVPEKPRFRLVVVFSRGVSAKEYSKIWSAEADRIESAGHEIDKSCKDASRLWFLPCRRDEHYTTVIQEGQPLDVEGILIESGCYDVPETPTPTDEPSGKDENDKEVEKTPPQSEPEDGESDKAREQFVKKIKALSRLENIIKPAGGWEKKTEDRWRCSSPLRAGDTNPSFYIKLSEQVWYDFGLGAGGDVLTYYQKLWGCSYRVALNRRAQQLGIERFSCSDLGNAERLAFRFGKRIHYVPAWKKWLIWTGKRWREDDKQVIERLAQEAVRGIDKEADNESDPDRKKALRKHAVKSEANGRKVALIEQAKSLPGIPITPEDLDRDLWLFNAGNGTVDLRTGELRPHRREDLLTKISDTAYQPDAVCPTYERFLAEVLPDPEIRELVWMLDASSLSGEVRDHWLAYHYGGGRNGKTTHEEIILHVFGDYGRKIPSELLVAKRGESHPTEKTTLYGIRYAAASETEENRLMNVAFMKQATGGDRISARRMREDYWEFAPTHHLHINGNHKLIIRETKDAIWDRLLLIPWTVRIEPDRQDKRLGKKLKAEAPGILARLVQRCLVWQRDGLRIPDAVRLATQEYRDDMDVLGDFIATCCIVGEAETAVTKDTRDLYSAKALYQAYKWWAEDNGEMIVSQTAFGTQLRERGFDKKRNSKGRTIWTGIRVRTPEESSDVTWRDYREPGPGMMIDEEAMNDLAI